ncbi:creatininase family protein [Halarsenatibacter silvermanii]|uniref:Creatinine amidohydrolase n=1 Tax=Halarsenatibacter silvermanii TaxID=321763 RepID=A0A1G9MZJ0_9FIRM|nr:creatininase family protein [Halarsenatibacter silvermanii]SDL79700.1 creatinine amidohydrolase [Halarsenatibacter silvermanii]
MSEKRSSVWLNELTWQEVEKYLEEKSIIVLPVGSTEQHGPAGPLGLDTYAAIALAEDTAEKKEVLTVPPLWFGDSSHHLGFPGSISLKTETLNSVIKDVVSSLARGGFDKFLVINGHKGANLAAVSSALKTLHEEEFPEKIMALADPLHLSTGISPQIKETNEHHAGELEISHIWHKYPRLIKEDKLTETGVDLKEVLSPFAREDLMDPSGDYIEVFWNSEEQREFAPEGSFSPSAKASKEKGRKYHEYMVERLGEFIDWMRQA